MALSTYLDLVNNVLARLRENTVTSVNDSEYSRLIKIMINDSKREIENSNDWSSLRTNLFITTANEVDTYTLDGSSDHFTVREVYNITSKSILDKVSDKYMDAQTYLSGPVIKAPEMYTFKGVAPVTGDARVKLFPVPDGVYTLRFEVVQRPSDLVNDSDTVLVPGHLVELLTFAKAIAERGEDGGNLSNEVYAQFLVNLGDAIALEKSRFPEETIWEVT